MSGKWHFHALVFFPEKIRSRDMRFFDIDCPNCEGGHHPNIQHRGKKVKEWDQNKFEYCMKEDLEPLMSENFIAPFYKNSKGFTKCKQDYENWLQALRESKLKVIKEIKMPYNPSAPFSHFEFNTEPTRRALLILHGKPGCGKTKWVQNSFQGHRVFFRNPHKYPYEGYRGQNVIVFDDVPEDIGVKVVPEEIISVLNFYRTPDVHVWGSTRYTSVKYPDNHQRYIIWLMNTDKIKGVWQNVLTDPRIVSRTFCEFEVHSEEVDEQMDESQDDGVIRC